MSRFFVKPPCLTYTSEITNMFVGLPKLFFHVPLHKELLVALNVCSSQQGLFHVIQTNKRNTGTCICGLNNSTTMDLPAMTLFLHLPSDQYLITVTPCNRSEGKILMAFFCVNIMEQLHMYVVYGFGEFSVPREITIFFKFEFCVLRRFILSFRNNR